MENYLPNRPNHVNIGIDENLAKPDAAKFLKNFRVTFNKNANTKGGTGTDINSGNNFGSGTKLLSNTLAAVVKLPEGVNKNVGWYECLETNELFYLNWNSNKNHGIYVLKGDSGTVDKVIVDPLLNFSILPEYYVSPDRCHVRIVYDKDANGVTKIKEKYFIFTDGYNWQFCIAVLAAIRTDGFNEVLYPYWRTKAPHFDRRELFQLPVRRANWCPTVTALPITADDKKKQSGLLKKSFTFAQAQILTDNRGSVFSNWSNPFSIKQTGCNPNNNNVPRCLEITLYAGSPLVEKIQLYVRNCNGDWYLWDTIEKFKSCGDNDPEKIGDEYWNRKNPWDGMQYDEATNTIKYRFCADKEFSITSQEDANTYETGLPITSGAMTAVGDELLLGDNTYYYPNLPCETLNNIEVTVGEASQQSGCTVVNRKIKLYSYIGRAGMDSQFAYINGTDKKVRFGGIYNGDLGANSGVVIEESDLFGLNYGDNQGPICYLAGTPYFAIGKQYSVDKAGVKTFIGLLDVSKNDQKILARNILNEGGYFIMQYEFTVPQGKYIARLANHSANVDSDFTKTSTYVMGIVDSSRRNGQKVNENLLNTSYDRAKEIKVDCCNGDFDPWGNGKDMFYVYAPYDFVEDDKYLFITIKNRRWRFIEGYVREDQNTNLGVELLRYDTNHGYQEKKTDGYYTDHNGFYFAFTARGDAKKAVVFFWGNLNCKNSNQALFQNQDLPDKERGYYPAQNMFVSDKQTDGKFGIHNRILLRGKFIDCDTGTGLAGIAVTVTRGNVAYSDADGFFELPVHSSFEGARREQVYFNAGGSCVFLPCDCSCGELFDYNDLNNTCVLNTERVYPTTVQKKYRLVVDNVKALKGGGRYGIGCVVDDGAGRSTYVNLLKYVDIPTFLETKKYTPSVINWALKGPLKLPSWAKHLTFFRTKNLRFRSYLQWVGDKIEFLDSSGNVVKGTTGIVRARVTIQSLNDFNSTETFATTTTYQFVEGDIMRVYDDGDGNLFDITDGMMDYPILGTNWNQADQNTGNTATVPTSNTTVTTDGKSFIIPFDRRLLKLVDTDNANMSKCGFWIEIYRPDEEGSNEVYGQICGVYNVKDGELMNNITGGRLETWDTYYQNRFIKLSTCPGKTFNHPFESSSITDYWGKDCDSIGRKEVVDKFAEQTRYPDEVIRSDAFINEGKLNGFGTWRDKNRKPFKGQDFGPIVAMHAERSMILFICANDWFVTDYNMNYVKVTSEGLVIGNTDQALGEPHQKTDMKYGCHPQDRAALVFAEGFASYPDRRISGVILNDYKGAYDLSTIDNKPYFIEKFQFVNNFNKSLGVDFDFYHIEMVAGYDPKYKELNFTFRPRRGLNPSVWNFVNREREIHIDYQETFTFSLEQSKWVRFAAFTPESYATLHKSRTGQEMVAFMNGQPYFHNSQFVKTFNNFFGVDTESVVDVVSNMSPNDDKIFKSIAIDANALSWYIDRLFTDSFQSYSYVPMPHFKKRGSTWFSYLMRDMNSYPDGIDKFRKMIVDGKRIFGKFMRYRLVSDITKNSEYTELNGVFVKASTKESTTDKADAK